MINTKIIAVLYSFLIYTSILSCTSSREQLIPISVADFEQFIKETQYTTDAEKFGWSIVQQNILEFSTVEGANWQKPDGKTDAKPDFPVTQVSLNDARAYCTWSGTRLPTYEEYWELVREDKRSIAFNMSSFFPIEDVNIVGNVWEITASDDPMRVRLAGGSIFCDKNTCNGIAKERALYVDAMTGNLHIGFAVVKSF